MDIKQKLQNLITRALESMGMPPGMVAISLEHPDELEFGDYSTNVAMHLMKSMGATSKSPLALAEKIAEKIQEELHESKNPLASYIAKVEAVKPGFINFYLSQNFFTDSVKEILEKNVWYGKNNKLWNKKIIIEHTNLNPFKPFHIGHLVNNAIGESVSRILEFQDAKLTRASYGGDVGMHIAKALWGIMKLKEDLAFALTSESSVKEQVDFIGKAYAFGAAAFEEDEKSKKEIQDINKKVYDKSDQAINEVYEWGRKVSLEYFKELYKILGTKFDYQFFESQVADDGLEIVRAGLERKIFKESDGAVIFPGEEYGLHKRVFITSQGLPTYEAKELGLTKKKFEIHDFDESIVVTASEQNDYFKVVLKALDMLYPEIGKRMRHLSHGFLRLPTGKMSSRKGNAITGESLILDVEALVREKIADRNFSEKEKEEIVEQIAIGAIRYSILRQSVGKDIVFDFDASLSFEGDSGPYLQYTYVRAKSVLKKAEQEKIKADPEKISAKNSSDSSKKITVLEKLLYRFPEVVERAGAEFAPNYIVTFITEVASEFNSFYAQNKIVDLKDSESGYKIALTEAVSLILKNGMHLLGIQAPEKM